MDGTDATGDGTTDGFGDVDVTGFLQELGGPDADEQPLAVLALPSAQEAVGLSRRKAAKEWSEQTSPAGVTASHLTGATTRSWTSGTGFVSATATVFTAAPAAVEFFERETGDAALAQRRERYRDQWAAKLAAAGGDGASTELTVTVTPIAALTAAGERACSEAVILLAAPTTGREQSWYERVAHLRVGRLVVTLLTREPGPGGVVMAGFLGRYETRLREQAGHYR
ncbi:MAG: hypothetical protein U0W40_02095 [Acidimicrobiia bacterium]